MAEVARMRIVAERQRQEKGGKGTEKSGKGDSRTCWTCRKARHIAASCPINEEAVHNEEQIACVVLVSRDRL